MLNAKTVFVLSPHPDDAEICCGGTIAKLVDNGATVYNFVFAKADERKKELAEATKVLGISKCFMLDVPIRNLYKYRQKILDALLTYKERYNPDLVLMPSLNDIHQDHKTVAEEGLRAFKNVNLLGYEAVWNNLNFDNQMFIQIKPEHLSRKIRAVKCYLSQKDKPYTDPDYIRSLMKVRGVQIGFANAEMFSLIRGVIK